MANRKRNVEFARPEEPAFIKKLKQKIGYTEGPNIETKSESLSLAKREDLEDREEEKPVVVVLKSGHLTEEEVELYKQELKDKDEEISNETNEESSKLVFKKPENINKKKNNFIQSSFAKSEEDSKPTLKLGANESKSVRNTNLLSFDDCDDENEDSD